MPSINSFRLFFFSLLPKEMQTRALRDCVRPLRATSQNVNYCYNFTTQIFNAIGCIAALREGNQEAISAISTTVTKTSNTSPGKNFTG